MYFLSLFPQGNKDFFHLRSFDYEEITRQAMVKPDQLTNDHPHHFLLKEYLL